jgi:hypothetical protein
MSHRSKATEQAFREAMQIVNGVACCIVKATAALDKSTVEAVKQCISAAQGFSQAELDDRDEGWKRLTALLYGNRAETVGFSQSNDTC